MRFAILPASLALLASAATPSFEAHGEDPGWSLTIAGGSIGFEHVGGPGRANIREQGRAHMVVRQPGSVRITAMIEVDRGSEPLRGARDDQPPLAVRTGFEPLSIEVSEAACTDAERRVRPTRVVIVREGGPRYRGCGGSLDDLAAALASAR